VTAERRFLPGGRRVGADAALLAAFVSGAHIAAAAERAGISERTARRRLADPRFQRDLAQARSDLVVASVNALSAAAAAAVAAMVDLLVPATPSSVRLGAARAILELGLRLREGDDLLARLDALERAVSVNRP